MSSWSEECERRRGLWGTDWPGHPDGACSEDRTEASLRDEPDRWSLLLLADDNGSYDYDELALMRRDDGELALLRTSGCSCPSPTETWGVLAHGSWSAVVGEVQREIGEWGADRAQSCAPHYVEMLDWMAANPQPEALS